MRPGGLTFPLEHDPTWLQIAVRPMRIAGRG
jgi:hypothetical protein